MNDSRSAREWRRMRAWELKQEGWTQTAIAEALGVSAGAVSQWMKQAREAGVDGLKSGRATGRPPRLSAEQRARIPELLLQGAEAHGFRGDVWTRARVAEVIRREFGVRQEASTVGRLLRGLGWTVQKPVKRARQQDAEEVQRWYEERWPALEKRPAITGG